SLVGLISIPLSLVLYWATSTQPSTSIHTTGDRSPVIGTNKGSVWTIFSNPEGKEKLADPRSHLLIGRWKGVQKMANGQLVLNGYTRLLDSGRYNATGEWATQGTVDGRLGEVIHGFSTTGTWKLDGDKLTTTVTDFKTQPKVLKVEGQPD